MKKIFVVISAMLVFGLAVAVYSFASTADLSATAAACCCCSGDSCPMKTKDASGKETASCCDDCDCCKGGAESCPTMKKDADGKLVKTADHKECPMMKTGADAKTMKMDAAKECPMMKKDANGNPMRMDVDAPSGIEIKHDMKMNGKTCPCCHKAKDKEKTAVPAV